MRHILLFLVLSMSTVAAQQPVPKSASTQPPEGQPRAEILILGSYHMANPGHDVYNMKVDDVLGPKRQQELADLMTVLKRFRPTKIAIESNVGSKARPQQYADYLGGKHTLTSNEIEQIGFRLAKETGLTTIFPVDEDGDFPYMRVQNYAKANGMTAKWDAMNAASQKRVQEENDFLLSHSILENLLRENSDGHVRDDMSWYWEIVRFGDPYDYAGPDLLASWYQRNIRIYHNIARLADSPKERILVIYGYGHLGWLRQDAQNDPAIRLRKLEEFVK